jgi:hypothetical protein
MSIAVYSNGDAQHALVSAGDALYWSEDFTSTLPRGHVERTRAEPGELYHCQDRCVLVRLGGVSKRPPSPEHNAQPNQQRMIVIINRGAGHHQEETQAQIEKLFQSRGIAARVLVARHTGEIAHLAEAAARSDAEVVVAAGGDGTIDGIASVLAGTGKTLGVLPLGTFNLFAKRVNIPLDLGAAVQTVLSGRVAKINVGEVNSGVFLSRSGVGLYPLALRQP